MRGSSLTWPASSSTFTCDGLGQEHPHHRLAALVVPAEIVERIVVMALDDRARGRGNRS